MSYLRYLPAYSDVQHILCRVVFLFCLSCVLCIVMSNTYCVVLCFFLFSLLCVPYVAFFSEMSFFLLALRYSLTFM